MFADRKASFKQPPKPASQESRRAKALEEQKRRRAERFDSNRQLDRFADLSLGQSDNEEADQGEDADQPAAFTPASVAAYASMVEPYQPPNAISGTLKLPEDAATAAAASSEVPMESASTSPTTPTASKKRRKKKGKNKNASKWADKCMYAELLEMSADDPWSDVDGLPEDLETGWVAVGPVPVGKRCLAVTHQSSGIAGVVPNTTLRSRLLGKTLIPRFPSNLPPLTILDCILDANWRENGILHILDVVKWKGQDICDCEAPFRFWWRDTRLTELGPTTLVPPSYTKSHADHYQFPYPTRFLPIPYHTDTTLMTLYRHIIPLVRASNSQTIEVPLLPTPTFRPYQNPSDNPVPQSSLNNHGSNDNGRGHGGEDGMDVEPPPFVFGQQQPSNVTGEMPKNSHLVTTTVQSDGLLLYVAEASFESGTSPLSNWVPIVSYDVQHNAGLGLEGSDARLLDGPLDVFERLVLRRLQKRGISVDGNQDITPNGIGQVVEVEMA